VLAKLPPEEEVAAIDLSDLGREPVAP
jgi:hypothetical protein